MILSLLSMSASASAEGLPELYGVEAALLIDAVTGKPVTAKAEDEQEEFAGLVRLPVLLEICLAFDEGRLFENTVVTVSPEAAAVRGATAFLAPNERIAADLLLKAAVMLNAGDAVHALIQALYPSAAAAAEAVSGRLASLGIEKSPSGYLCEGLSFSANEVAAICRELAKSPSFLKYSSVYTDTLPHASASATELVNPNRLIRHYSGCYGLATGSVGSSHYCGAFIARRGGTTFIAVLAGAGSSDARFSAARELLDYGFSAYRTVDIKSEGEAVGEIPIKGGLMQVLSVITGGEVSALMPVNDTKVTTECLLPPVLEAPVDEGQTVGLLKITDSSGAPIAEVPLIAAHSVKKVGFSDCFMRLVSDWLGLE